MLGAKAIARAKINLFLQVGPLRADGYHDIRSIMQSIELCDELYFRRTDGSAGDVVIRCNESRVPASADNLVASAARVFNERTGPWAGGLDVLINKRIPVGAGLAGGSADAAAALFALNRIYETDLPLEALSSMGAEVGSDVPFCLVGGTALVRGRGEDVTSLGPLPPLHVVLATTGEEASTAEVYARFDERARDGAGDLESSFEELLRGIRNHDFDAIYANLHNSLESATIAPGQVELYKSVALDSGASAAMMTGSGPTVFALVNGMELAAEVAWELEKAAPVTIVTSFAERGAELSEI